MELSLEDISAVIEVVLQVCDRWDDPRAWREHLLTGACHLLDGNVGTMFDAGTTVPDRIDGVRALAAVGLPEPIRKSIFDPAIAGANGRESSSVMPWNTRSMETFQQQGWFTYSRDEITDLATYRSSDMYQNFRRLADCDDFVWSGRGVDLPRRVEVLQVDRPHGARPFGWREVAILKLLHDKIAPLVGVRLATEEHLCRDGLSRRLRETLSILLEGASEKEVQQRLGLSPRTVHQYVQMLYKHFQVSSRAELLAYFIRRKPVERRTS